MDEHVVNPDVASALSSVKSVLAIVNGLTLTNTLLVLITGGHYSDVIPLEDLDVASILLALVLMVNIVRFYHGNVRHLDAAYGTEGVALAASGRHVEPRGGLGLDFFVVFAQSLLFSITSFYVNSPSAYVMLFIVLLTFDIIWTVYSQQGEREPAASPQRMWLLNNIFAITIMITFFILYVAHPGRQWTLGVAVGVLATTTVIDFVLNWKFYFPGVTRKWHPGDSLKVFLSAPLTQYVRDENPSDLDYFRRHWGRLAKALERSGHDVFSAHQREAWGADLDSPESALKADVAGLLASDLVIAYVGNPASPGVQMELGYAIATRKRLLVFIDYGQAEPYLVRGLETWPHSEVVEIADLSSISPVLVRKGFIDTPEPAYCL